MKPSNRNCELSAKTIYVRLHALDALRGILALIVLLVHASVINGTIAGGVAVDLFFILSGFVVVYRFQGEVICGEANFCSVMKSRVLRLYPLHIVTFFYMLVLIISAYHLDRNPAYFREAFGWHFDSFATKVLTNILMINGVGLTSPLTFNGPSWSISVEFVLAPLLFLLMAKRNSIKFVFIVAFFMSLLMVVALDNHDDHYPNIWQIFNIGLMRGFVGMTVGFVAYKVYAGGRLASVFQNFYGSSLLLASAVFCAYVAFVPKRSLVPDIDMLLIWFAGPLMIIGLSYRQHVPRILVYLGSVSFSLYMWQIPVITTLGLVLDAPPSPWLSVPMVLAVAVASNLWFEKFITNKFRILSDKIFLC